MVVLSHPTGNTFVRAAAKALHETGSLLAFHTTVVAPSEGMLHCLPEAVRRQIMRRSFAGIPPTLVKTHPGREALRLAASAFHLHGATAPGGWAGIDAVSQSFDRAVARAVGRLPANVNASAAYCYEDAAEHTFRAARRRDLSCVYELPIAYWQTTQRLLREEAERLPAWRPTLQGLDDAPEKLDRKDREIDLADTVVVPSRFVLESLPRGIRQTKRCLLAPFGSPGPLHERDAEPAQRHDRLRVLFAGAMTQRKGLGDLFAAMRLLDRTDVELVVMGSALAPMSFYRDQYPGFVYEPPRPHAGVLELMRRCDILALPALVEGRALVQQEALANGLPLVVTPNAGGEDLIDEGRTGFLVPIRSPETLADRMAWFADHRPLLAQMRRCARQKAADASWRAYEACVREAVAPAVRSQGRAANAVS